MVYLQRILQGLVKKKKQKPNQKTRAFGVRTISAVMVIYLLKVLQTPVKEYICGVSAVGKCP